MHNFLETPSGTKKEEEEERVFFLFFFSLGSRMEYITFEERSPQKDFFFPLGTTIIKR